MMEEEEEQAGQGKRTMTMEVIMTMEMMNKSPSKTARLRLSDVVRLFGILQSDSNLWGIMFIMIIRTIMILNNQQ